MPEVDFLPPGECSQSQCSTRYVNVFLRSKKQPTGQWDSILNTEAFVNGRKVEPIVSHEIEECGRRRTVTINVSCFESQNGITAPKNEVGTEVSGKELQDDKLLFHPLCGKNAEVIDEGKILKKCSDLFDYTSGFSSRPLKDNEVFEVRLDEKGSSGYPIAIGVIAKSPDDLEIADNMSLSEDTSSYWCNFLYCNGKEMNITCEKSTSDLKVGQTLGVMRNESGDLQFYFDGNPQGFPMKNVPSEVYGMVELLGRGTKVSIVHV